ncbi:hypothetical protein EYR41_006117 [Orbilia oligospora]|uniref:Uncharacterized protein n=1 Tax=Orbilia oligospora TaxID=2813651 RepID=A0A8H2E0G8_ORBOL|nr:hypothetical protein EYR41_006117 [Orbilia oligospora]
MESRLNLIQREKLVSSAQECFTLQEGKGFGANGEEKVILRPEPKRVQPLQNNSSLPDPMQPKQLSVEIGLVSRAWLCNGSEGSYFHMYIDIVCKNGHQNILIKYIRALEKRNAIPTLSSPPRLLPPQPRTLHETPRGRTTSEHLQGNNPALQILNNGPPPLHAQSRPMTSHHVNPEANTGNFLQTEPTTQGQKYPFQRSSDASIVSQRANKTTVSRWNPLPLPSETRPPPQYNPSSTLGRKTVKDPFTFKHIFSKIRQRRS